MSNERVERWRRAIESDPASYLLTAYGPWMTPERAAAYWARWQADEEAGAPSPALCRRCGKVLRPITIYRRGQQLHAYCTPTGFVRPQTYDRSDERNES